MKLESQVTQHATAPRGAARAGSVHRREALRRAAALGALVALGGPAWSRTRSGPRVLARDPRADGEEPVLILVQLTGGNDGLSTVVPYGDDLYHKNRDITRFAADEVLPLDDHVGLHPELRGLRALYDGGHLALVQGSGYPKPNRSHFKSMEIWHAADPRGRAVGAGWVGRLCEVAFGRDTDAARLVHVGGTVPYSLYSSVHGASSFLVPESYRWLEKEAELARYDEREALEPAGAPPASQRLEFLRGVLADARETSQAIRGAVARYRPVARYTNDPFALDLLSAAALVNGGIGVRVLSVELRGFDTHSAQRATHDVLMRRLDQGLSALLADLDASAAGRNAVVLVFSEFGRRLAENGSRGTDHGAAGPMLVAGARVRGGLHGRHPSLAELDEGDLIHTTDFRSVYAAAIDACFRVNPASVLGAEFPRLDLIA